MHGASARILTHAVKLHEWSIQAIGWILCMGHPPLWVEWAAAIRFNQLGAHRQEDL
jgi:hypothetical protein